jgi:hypothetical protein
LNGNPFVGLQKGKVSFLTTLGKKPTCGRQTSAFMREKK